MKKTHKKATMAIAASTIIIPLLVFAQNTSTTTPVTTCPLIRTYMNLGRADNRPDEVAKLQAFLKNSQNLDVDVTGTFDQKTDAAVREFQRIHADTVLSPWGGTKTSGYVYITTSKKINEIACNQPMTFSPSDVAAIQAFKSKIASDTVTPVPSPTTAIVTQTSTPRATPTVTPQIVADTSTTTDKEDENEDESDNLAASGDASMVQKFAAFLRGLFD